MLPNNFFIRLSICVLVFSLNVSSTIASNIDEDLSTPKNAIETHLRFLQKDSYDPERRPKLFRYLQAALTKEKLLP